MAFITTSMTAVGVALCACAGLIYSTDVGPALGSLYSVPLASSILANPSATLASGIGILVCGLSCRTARPY